MLTSREMKRSHNTNLLLPVIVALMGWCFAVLGRGSADNLALARQLNSAFAEVAEKVSPAVVVIRVVQKPTSDSAGGSDNEADSSDGLPRDFWRYFHRQFEGQPPESLEGEGSGFLVREDGYILTSHHVVEDAERIEVRLHDRRTFQAKVRGVDPQSDLAVIKIDAKGLPVARFADSAKLRVGEFAIAVGSPFELDYSVTFGHVSAKGRSNLILGDSGAAMDQDFIQTDASINPGNSGGPLVNIDAEVIGVNSMIRGARTGIGFAVPSNLAKEISDKLIAEGRFTRAWLGVGIRALRDTTLQGSLKGIEDGVIVASIQPDGPAAKSDLRPGDIITAIEGKRVGTAQELRTEVRGKPVGKDITLEVYRQKGSQDGRMVQVKVAPREWVQAASAVAVVKPSRPLDGLPNELGLTVHTLSEELAERFNLEKKTGVLVVAVEPGTPGGRKGIKPGDIITSINKQPVTSLKDFRELLKKADLKKGVVINFVTGDKAHSEVLKKGVD